MPSAKLFTGGDVLIDLNMVVESLLYEFIFTFSVF